MRFLYPLGLLGLLGIPILVTIYILKNKHTEQTVSSTYLWTLSEKFLKRKIRVSRLAGILILLVQILIITMVSLAIAHPTIILKNKAKEYCFIVDCSGSMNISDGGVSRFDESKKRIEQIVDESVQGSVFTLMSVSNESTQIVVERVENKDVFMESLQTLKPTQSESNFTDALLKAQEYFNNNGALKTYIFTDKECNEQINVEVVNLAKNETNYTIVGASYIHEGNELELTATLLSHETNADVLVKMYVDDAKEPFRTQEVALIKGEEKIVKFGMELVQFEKLTIRIASADGLLIDNEYILYSPERERERKTLIVSKTPFFIVSALKANGITNIETVTPQYYHDSMEKINDDGNVVAPEGYGLYVYDNANEDAEKISIPRALPISGTVWMFNVSNAVAGAGFSFKSDNVLDVAKKLELTKSTASLARKLVTGMDATEIYVKKYLRYGLYEKFTTLLSIEGQPLVFAGKTAKGNREVVFSFSLSDTNFPMLADFVALMRNLVEYSFPQVMEKTNYTSGEKIEVNLPSSVSDIEIVLPQGEKIYPVDGVELNEVVLDEVGEYALTFTVAGERQTYNAFVSLPMSESVVTATLKETKIEGTATQGGLDGIYDNLVWIFLAMMLLFGVDWVVYCYGKYELR